MDRAEFETLYRQTYGRVLAFALRRTTKSSAADAAAETFLIAWRRRDDIVGDPLPWLLGITRRVLANHRRTTGRAAALVVRASAQIPAAEQSTPEADLSDRPLAQAFASLRETDKEALALTVWDELSPGEAAHVAGCSSATFRVRLHRARKRLAHALAEAEAVDPTLSTRPATIGPDPE